ncbi:alpha 1,2 mannosyltransferase [Arachnomyces sp. PD_36]|nr:alpha 1,2 mannosyltransferase [Arachnomyces sp. PD_36]
MWRRTYLLLLLIRVYFALSPSYLHPDENFQGPEVFAGRVYSYPSRLTWEFTSAQPLRSVFPLWPVYGLPMTLLKWLWTEGTDGTTTPPELIYYVLRAGMFVLSFVLEDWAVYELVPSPRHRRQAVVLVASSYVTWTYQTHTFSNSAETLLVAWGLVLIQRIVENKQRSSIFSCAILSFVTVVGVFNRITFPAFILIPGLQLVPHFWRKPFSFITLLVFGLFFTFVAISVDTAFYKPSVTSFLDVFNSPVITPLNNFLYNSDSTNLASHGLHSRYQHFLVNLPQLLGPVFILLVRNIFAQSTIPTWMKNWRAISALSATFFLSIFPHQEPRFLIPAVPLLLTCLGTPRSRVFLGSWVVFNVLLGALMGVYHQGGVIPTQLQIPTILAENAAPTIAAGTNAIDSAIAPPATVFWWKTYPPPLWLLGDGSSNSTDTPIKSIQDIETKDLMGVPGPEMIRNLKETTPTCPPASSWSRVGRKSSEESTVLLVAPLSATFLDPYIADPSLASSGEEELPEIEKNSLQLHQLWSFPRHLNLDDMDFGDDGIWSTLKRVIGRKGLGVWAVRRRGC